METPDRHIAKKFDQAIILVSNIYSTGNDVTSNVLVTYKLTMKWADMPFFAPQRSKSFQSGNCHLI